MKNTPFILKLAWLLCFLFPIASYFVYIADYGINIPYVDDHGLKGFILKYYASDHISDKIAAIFAQHNEHRIALTRIFLLISYQLEGTINYKTLIWLGNGFLLGILWVFVRYFKHKGISLVYLLPIPWILFTFLHQENTFWGMASVQNFGIVFFVFAAFLALEKEQFIKAMVLISIGVFTSGNGFVALFLLMGILLLKGNWKQLGLFALLTLCLLAAYFLSYQKPPATPMASVSQLKDLSKAFFAFTGSYADMNLEIPLAGRVMRSAILGLLLIGLSLGIYGKNLPIDFREKRWRIPANWPIFLLGTITFILLSAAMVAWTRLVGYGFNTILTSRYKIYSVLLLITLYAGSFTLLKNSLQKINFGAVLVVAITCFFMSFWHSMPSIDFHRKGLTTSMFNWTYEDFSGKKPLMVGFKYENPPIFFDGLLPELLSPNLPQAPVFKLAVCKVEKGDLIISGSGDFHFKTADDGIYILAKSAKRCYVFPTHTKKNSVKKALLSQELFIGSFDAHIANYEFEAGTYHIGILTKEGTKIQLLNCQDSVQLVRPKVANTIKTNW